MVSVLTRYGELCSTGRDTKGLKLNKDIRTKNVMLNLISLYHEGYFNTDYSSQTLGAEFYNVVDLINQGIVPLELKFLEVEELEDDILFILQNPLI